MNYTKEQVINGIINYIDREIINQMGTLAKVVIGTGVSLMRSNIEGTIDQIMNNPIVKSLGIIDEDGNVDIETLAFELKNNVNKYGKITMTLPFSMGDIILNSEDVDLLKHYIES